MTQLERKAKAVRRRVGSSVPDAAYYLYGLADEGEGATTWATDDADVVPSVARVRLSNATAAVASTRMRYWSLLDTVAEMANLPEGHDYGIPMETSLHALDILTKLSERAIDPPRIFSSDSDGLTLSWDGGALRHYLQVDKGDLDHLVVRPGNPKLYCHNPVLSTPGGRNTWLDEFAGPPVSSTAEEDAI